MSHRREAEKEEMKGVRRGGGSRQRRGKREEEREGVEKEERKREGGKREEEEREGKEKEKKEKGCYHDSLSSSSSRLSGIFYVFEQVPYVVLVG